MTDQAAYPELRLPTIRLETDDGRPLVELDPGTVRILASMALKQGQSYNAIIEQAILNEDFLGREEAAGSKLIIARGEELNLIERVPSEVYS